VINDFTGKSVLITGGTMGIGLATGLAFGRQGACCYKLRSLIKSIEYSAWPVVAYTRALKEVFGRYPRYVVGLSSEGPEAFVVDYDFVAASKAVLETLCRYLSYRLSDQDVRVNVVRAGLVQTESLRATTGPAFEELVSRLHMERLYTPAHHVAGAVVALCSGLMDGVSGQVIRVDSGTHFFNNLMGLYQQGGVLDTTSSES
jgi:NAD(P)-dependent dehydrogenase (short-subunit alcohol dehydrogenase family)